MKDVCKNCSGRKKVRGTGWVLKTCRPCEGTGLVEPEKKEVEKKEVLKDDIKESPVEAVKAVVEVKVEAPEVKAPAVEVAKPGSKPKPKPKTVETKK